MCFALECVLKLTDWTFLQSVTMRKRAFCGLRPHLQFYTTIYGWAFPSVWGTSYMSIDHGSATNMVAGRVEFFLDINYAFCVRMSSHTALCGKRDVLTSLFDFSWSSLWTIRHVYLLQSIRLVLCYVLK